MPVNDWTIAAVLGKGPLYGRVETMPKIRRPITSQTLAVYRAWRLQYRSVHVTRSERNAMPVMQQCERVRLAAPVAPDPRIIQWIIVRCADKTKRLESPHVRSNLLCCQLCRNEQHRLAGTAAIDPTGPPTDSTDSLLADTPGLTVRNQYESLSLVVLIAVLYRSPSITPPP